VNKAWIQTFTNRKFHILAPQPEEICIEDIAHALALQCRFTGHVKWHYSVAQHSVYASQIVVPGFEFEALMHDASEAYICDMSRPLKHYTPAGAAYLEVEAKIEAAIAARFGLQTPMSAEVKNADNLVLYAEKAQLMPPMVWDTRWAATEDQAAIKIERWTPEEAEQIFLNRFYEFTSN
jgi:uncharacterized protein